MSGFKWDQSPEETLMPALDAWNLNFFDGLEKFFAQEAQSATAFLQQAAPWEDRTYKARHGLRAESWQDGTIELGLTASYSQNTINPRTGQRYSYNLEEATFPYAGILSVILNRRPETFLGDWAWGFMDRLRILVGDKGLF